MMMKGRVYYTIGECPPLPIIKALDPIQKGRVKVEAQHVCSAGAVRIEVVVVADIVVVLVLVPSSFRWVQMP